MDKTLVIKVERLVQHKNITSSFKRTKHLRMTKPKLREDLVEIEQTPSGSSAGAQGIVRMAPRDGTFSSGYRP